MNIFITGGTGFIGRWTVAHLSQQGHQIRVLTRNAEARQAELSRWIQQHGGNPSSITLLEGDLAKPQLGLSENDQSLLQNTDVIYHMGADFDWGLSATKARQITVDGSKALLELAAGIPTLKQFVHLSGFMMAAPHIWQFLGLDATQQDATQALNQKQIDSLYKSYGAYEASKIESHFLIQHLCAEKAIPLTGILLSSAIGHSETGEIDQPQGIPMLVKSVRNREMPVIPGTAKDWIPLVTVDYLVSFITGVLTLPETIGENYVVLDEETPTFAELLKLIAVQTGVKPPTLFIPKKIIQVLLKLGLEKIVESNAESLDFLQPFRFNTQATQKVADKLGINKPDIRTAILNMVDYLIANDFGKHSLVAQ